MKCVYLKQCIGLMVVMMMTISGLWAQARPVHGTVSDASGIGIPGVGVTVQGTTVGVSTDAQGKYSLRVNSDDAVLEFNFLGYTSQEVPVGGRTIVDVVMAEDAEDIDEVVVIGYGTVRKRDLTGSVASIGGDEIATMPVANVGQALQGKIAGVNITTGDGRPDAGIKIRVRGGGSVTQNNDPLYVVDGFPVDNINDIPPAQIESINILKDASSTAIYGARGANGVVLVTTKNPTESRMTITYDMYYQVKTLPNDLSLLQGGDYVMFNWELFELGSQYNSSAYQTAFAIGQRGTQVFKDGIDQYDNRSTNWLKEIYGGPASSWSHNINISGGNGKTGYSLGYNSISDDALRNNSWFKRQTVTAKLNQELARGLKLSFDTRFNDAEVFGSSSSTYSSIVYSPVTPLGDYDPATNPNFNMNADQVNPKYNPINMIDDVYDLKTRKSYQINASLSWEILDGLTFKTEYGVRYFWGKNYNYQGPLTKKDDTYGLEASIERNEFFSSRFVNTLNYQIKGLGDQHRLDFLIGQEANESQRERSKMLSKGLPRTFDFTKAFGAINDWDKDQSISDMIKNTYSVPEKMLSYFGRVNYSFKDRYIFTATLRADGSSIFAPENRWGYFPAAAAAWRVNAEPFMQQVSWIDNLKLRISYGQVGNNRIDADLWRRTFQSTAGGYSFDNVQQTYYSPSSDMLINPDLKWETTITRNIGIDFGFFNNRLYGTIEGYWNTTKDLLIESTIPTYLGYTTQQQNIGQTKNTGIEFSIGGDIVRKKDLLISASFNIAHNKNKIEKLASGMDYKKIASGWGSTTITPYNDYMYQVGQSVGLIKGYIYDGFYTTDDFIYDASTNTYTLKPGIPNTQNIAALPAGVATGKSDTYAYPGAMKLKKYHRKIRRPSPPTTLPSSEIPTRNISEVSM